MFASKSNILIKCKNGQKFTVFLDFLGPKWYNYVGVIIGFGPMLA